MAAPTRCMATATRSLQSPQAARITYRTFASSTSSPAASSRKVAAANTTCLRQLQTARNAYGKAATSCQSQTRNFSQSASRSKLKTIDQIRARNKGGVCLVVRRAIHEMVEIWAYDQRLTISPAIQPHSRDPLRRSRWRTMGLLHIRERAHGTKADSRADKRHWQAQSRRAIPPRRPQRQAL
jgi:hypothetical protein